MVTATMDSRASLKLSMLFFGVLALLIPATPVFAQDRAPIQIEHFEPMPDMSSNLLNIGTSDMLPHLSLTGGALLQYVHTPLTLLSINADGTTTRDDVVSGQFKTDLLFAASFYEIFDVGLALPVIFFQSGNSLTLNGSEFNAEGTTIGDLRFTPRARLPFSREKLYGFGFGLAAPLYLPTGDTESFNGEGTVRWEPRLLIDWSMDIAPLRGPLTVAFNLGYQLRSEQTVLNHVNDDVLRWGVGVEVPLAVQGLQLLGSAFGTVGLSDNINPINDADSSDGRTSPFELLGAVRYEMPWDLVATLGGGAGLGEGAGAPAFRVFASIGYAPLTRDADEDGIVDDEDECPEIPEDKDGFADEDGCPDLDNDEDTIADVDDSCPDEAEDFDNFEDANGCPDVDNDEDTILDTADACPDNPEDPDGFEDEDGCPEDNDNDGIADADDQCPNNPEDADGFEDEDGCPEPDNDGDTVCEEWVTARGVLADYPDCMPNGVDLCADSPEDMDGFEDEDGCPEADNDKDGVCEKWVSEQGVEAEHTYCSGVDQCPDEPETINGIDDEDGCPDKGKTKVVITEKEVKILDRVFFDTNKATIKPVSFSILNQVAQVLKANPQVNRIRIEGHTDDRGDDDYNLQLSKDRANAVRDYLIAQGIDEQRLRAEGYGETQPIASNKRKSGREKNRRVEFRIEMINGEEVPEDEQIDGQEIEQTP